MSLKHSRFHVEPTFNYRGDVVEPHFGEPDEYVERIVEWVYYCPKPQTYGCYTLWKVLHQQKRIDVLEDMVGTMTDEMASLRRTIQKQQEQTEEILRRLERNDAQTQGLVGLAQAQERSIETIREKITPVTATVVEVECYKCGRCCGGNCSNRPFVPYRRPTPPTY